MQPFAIIFHLLCFVAVGFLPAHSRAQDEEPVFSGDETVTPAPAEQQHPDHPATAYWKISATVDVQSAQPGTHVQMLLPLSDARQSVLERRTGAEGVSYREEADGLNLWGHWSVTHAGAAPRQLFYEYTVQIVDTVIPVPTVPFPQPRGDQALQTYLSPSALIQSDGEPVRTQAQHLAAALQRVDQAIWAIYQHVAAFSVPGEAGQKNDALSVIQSQRGSRLGKTRALVALLRAVGVPARIVGGIRLGDMAQKRSTIAWAEVWVGSIWVPIDPSAGYFAWLPNTYLALYRNDLPLLMHTRKVPVEYTFFIRPVSRNAVLATHAGEHQPLNARHGGRHESDRLRAVTTYVDRPRANIVLLNDGPLPQGVVEHILAEAQAARVNAALLSVDFESSFSREHALQSLVNDNLSVIREANLLLVNTADTAGIYALLKQGEQGVRLDDLRVVIVSRVPRPVTATFAAVLELLLKPREIIVLTQPLDVFSLWRFGATSVTSENPIEAQLQKDGFVATVVNAQTVAHWSWWRRQVVHLWALAVQAHVPLPALSLILVLPLIAFFLVILRNVIGLETFGTFSPMLLALAFLTTGLIWGMVVFAIIVGLGTGLRLALQGLRLHLVSRVAILIAVVAVSMVGLTVLGATFGIGALLHVSIFPMVIMANIIENFTNTQLERGTREAFRLTFHTLLVATVSYVGIESTGLKPFVLAFPEVLMLIIGVEVLLGRWRGLRLLEYWRFAKLMGQAEVPPAVETRKVSTG